MRFIIHKRNQSDCIHVNTIYIVSALFPHFRRPIIFSHSDKFSRNTRVQYSQFFSGYLPVNIYDNKIKRWFSSCSVRGFVNKITSGFPHNTARHCSIVMQECVCTSKSLGLNWRCFMCSIFCGIPSRRLAVFCGILHNTGWLMCLNVLRPSPDI